jgi:hypothetical protein
MIFEGRVLKVDGHRKTMSWSPILWLVISQRILAVTPCSRIQSFLWMSHSGILYYWSCLSTCSLLPSYTFMSTNKIDKKYSFPGMTVLN